LRDPAAVDGPKPIERVGPNAILQTAQALSEFHGTATRDRILARVGVPASLLRPAGMVDAVLVRSLNDAVRDCLPAQAAMAVMRRAGQLTGDYILANRIPKPAMRLLSVLPRFLAPHLLLIAIGRHSWTFAGSCPVRIRHGWRSAEISIIGNPISFGPCVWHEAVFHRLLLPLTGPSLSILEVECCSGSALACRFVVSW